MGFTNSPLAKIVAISPNRTSPRNQPITKITVHHMAGVLSAQDFCNIVARPSREMSANYGIGYDGTIALTCPEGDRSWCSSSPRNDHRAITIEVSNSASGGEWPIGTAAYNALIDLCVDICKRNNIPTLVFTGDENGSLTFHYMFAATACLPIDRTELLTPTGWKYLKDIKIGDTVATVHIDNMGIKFDSVENMVHQKTQDTYLTRDFEATSDHRILYYNQNGRQTVGYFSDIFDKKGSTYLPNAGFIENPVGLSNLTPAEIEFLVAVQADGHYMNDKNCFYGLEFHFSKDRKIKRIKELLKSFGYEFKEHKQPNGTTKIRIYGKKYVIYCEQYLNNKCFTWDWMNMNRSQVKAFFDSITFYDGCKTNDSYSSSKAINIDVVQAIAALNGIGTKVSDNGTRVYFKKYMRSIGDNKRKRKPRQEVSCVTVRSGFILIRQHGRTTITGNCPGPWMKAHAQDLCNRVNARLGSSSSTPLGLYTVSLTTGTPIYNIDTMEKTGEINASTKYTITQEKTIDGTKYGRLKSGAGWVILSKPEPSKPDTSYTVKLNASDLIYESAGGRVVGSVGANGVFTIVEDKTVGYEVFGKLKSGAGWVITKRLEAPKPVSWWSGKYDPQIKELQQILNVGGAGLVVDGIAGDKTFAACKKYTVVSGDTGNLIRWVQKRLGVSADGCAGPQTMNAIYAFQRKNGLGVGYLGGDDWKYLIR